MKSDPTFIGTANITALPVITSAPAATFIAGTGGTFQVTATGAPATFTFRLSGPGLPAGVTIASATGLLTVAPSVPAGSYTFDISASNGINPDAVQSFTLTVNDPPVYTITASPSPAFGSQRTPYTPPPAQTVTITNTGTGIVALTQPAAVRYDIGTLSATSLNAGETATFTIRPKAGLSAGVHNETITITGTGGASANVVATFTVTPGDPPLKDSPEWLQAKALIESVTFTLTQQQAPDAHTARFALANLINELLAVGMRNASSGDTIPSVIASSLTLRHFDKLSASQSSVTATGSPTASSVQRRKGAPLQTDADSGEQSVRSSTAAFVVSPYDIVMFSFTPANAGTASSPTGVHGKFEFRVTPPSTATSAYSSGTITASPVSNDVIAGMTRNPLRAWTHNGILYVSGLQPGTSWSIYNLSGTRIYTGTVTADVVETHGRVSLPERGIYIVTDGNNSLKIINR